MTQGSSLQASKQTTMEKWVVTGKRELASKKASK